jgi:DNA processing protein
MLGIGRWGPLGRDVPGDWGGGGGGEAGGGRAPERPDPERPDPVTEREAWVVLAGVPGIGPVSFARLLAAFGTASVILRAATEPGAAPRLVAATADRDGGSPSLAAPAAAALLVAAADPDLVLAPVRRSGVGVITLADDGYPARLRRIDLPPPVLFLRGDLAALDRPSAVAVVGTRRPTAVGRATAARIADAVAGRGATIVSGLAFGVDAAAHAATVRLGAPTVAVIGGGHERLYPASHRGLADAIVAAGGAVVSEFAPDTPPSRGTFPRRNRIISGLADATVVVEAGARSGALTTAAWALEQGRDLYIVPGRLDDPAVAGSLAFLREAGPEARVVAGIAELLEDLGLGGDVAPSSAAARIVRSGLGPAEAAAAAALVAGAATPDEIAAATGLPGASVLAVLTALEIRGLVVEAFGRYRAAGPLAGAGGHGAPAARARARVRAA